MLHILKMAQIHNITFHTNLNSWSILHFEHFTYPQCATERVIHYKVYLLSV